MAHVLPRPGRHALSHIESVFTVPDQFPVPEYLFNTLQRNAVQFTPGVYQVEGNIVTGFEKDFAQGYANDSAGYPAMVADLEVTLAEDLDPGSANEQFMYRYYGKPPPPDRAARL